MSNCHFLQRNQRNQQQVPFITGHVVRSFISALLTWKSSSDLHQHGQIARPVACCQYIPHPPHTPLLSLSCSLLMYRLSVQRRKACLLRRRVSKKRTRPVSPSFTIQPDKTSDHYLHAASALHGAGRLLHGCHGNCRSALLWWLWRLTQTLIWKDMKVSTERFLRFWAW